MHLPEKKSASSEDGGRLPAGEAASSDEHRALRVFEGASSDDHRALRGFEGASSDDHRALRVFEGTSSDERGACRDFEGDLVVLPGTPKNGTIWFTDIARSPYRGQMRYEERPMASLGPNASANGRQDSGFGD